MGGRSKKEQEARAEAVLKRLNGVARPESQQVVEHEVPSHVTPNTTSHVTTQPKTLAASPASEVPSATSSVDARDTSHVTSHDEPNVAVTPVVEPQEVEGLELQDILQKTAHVTSHVWTHVPTNKPRAESPALARNTARIRGRWTAAQLAWLKTMATTHATSKAEVIRHVVGWYLNQGASFPVPAEPELRPRGMKILDYLTTEEQAAAIRKVAQNGEAAWLRRAVDTYRIHGTFEARAAEM